MHLNILTFNWHEPYICHLAKLGHTFYVAAPELGPDKFREWDRNMRDLPSNCRLLSLKEAHSKLMREEFDLVIAHNVKDLIGLDGFYVPKIGVFHCRLSTEIALSPTPVNRDEYLEKIAPFLEGVSKVFISESKRTDWNLEGEVVDHGIDLDEYDGYTGEQAAVLRVGNLLKEMDLARGFTISERILAGFPNATLGLNPTLSGSRLSNGFADLLNHYRQCRIYLNTTPAEYEDGYNLSMLEAMATGMPVVTTDNPSSPIVHGVNGYRSNDVEALRGYIRELLVQPEKARVMGQRARETVREQFGMERFLEQWRAVIQDTLVSFLEASGVDTGNENPSFQSKKKKNILMDYVAHPATTAHYLHRALKKNHNVVTCGAMITHEVIRQWELGELRWPIEPQDIFRGSDMTLQQVFDQLPEQWQPDFYLYVETGLSSIPSDLDSVDIPKVCYLIDTHIHGDRHLEIARQFDHVFLAQKEYVDQFKANGINNVFWLPLGCDPEIHGQQEVEKKYDIGFVGSITPAHARRKALLDKVSKHLDLHVERKFMDEMARVFCESRVVFNNAIRNDLNMRVFEAMCSGSVLATDEAPGSGLTEMFKDGEHLVIYRDENLIETLQKLLDCPEKAEAIAARGRQEVLAHHTYDHRADKMVKTLEDVWVNEKNKSSENGNAESSPSEYYQHVREDVIALVPTDAETILEVGCGAGRTGESLKSNSNRFVAGVELHPEIAEKARERLDDVVVGSIEDVELPYMPESFDCILFADVLEHLVNPLAALKKALRFLQKDGTVIASIPNVQFYGLVHHLVEGNWTYQDEGILDRTHLRFFTYKEMEKLFHEAGLKISRVEETLAPQYEKFLKTGSSTLKIGRISISDISPEEARRFFVFQYKIVAQRISCPQASEEGPLVSTSNELQERLTEAGSKEKSEEFTMALEKYSQIANKFKDAEEAWAGMGRCYLRLHEPDSAEDCFQKALAINPGSVKGWMGMAAINMQEGKLAEAREGYLKVLDMDQENDKALCGVGLVEYQNGNTEPAWKLFVRSLEINVENSPAMTCLLQMAYEINRFKEPEEFLKKYLELHPANLNMLFGLAGVLFKQSKWEEAKGCLQKILVFDADHDDARQLMGAIQQESVANS